MAWSPGMSWHFWLRATLLVIGAVATSLFIHGSDNIQGYLHGVDRLTADRKAAQHEPKLLVNGEVKLREAVVMTAALLVVTLGIAVYFVLTSTWIAIIFGTFVFVLTVQYSVGVKMSYRGLGEVAVLLSGLGTPLAVGLLQGRLDGSALTVGVMLGLFFVAVNVNSNYADHPFDLAAGRRTLAVRIGLEGQRRLAVGVACAAWSTFLVAILVRALPVYALAGLILVHRHVRQLDALFLGDALTARRLGFGTFRRMSGIVTVAFLLEHGLV